MQSAASEIVIRVKSDSGFNRISVLLTETLESLKQKIAQNLKCSHKDFTLHPNSKNGPALQNPDSTKISSIPSISNGVEIYVRMKIDAAIPSLQKGISQTSADKKAKKPEEDHILTSLCNHAANAKCINCLGAAAKKDVAPDNQEKKCAHGPGGKCLNCVPFDKNTNEDKHLAKKWNCQHGPQGKCTHCLEDNVVTDAKHMSFDNFLSQRKANCKNHNADTHCINCIPPSAMSYRMNLTCKNHVAWPKAMCNKCIPQSANIKRQEYRHVDYAEFMNFQEITRFVNYWVKGGFGTQRIGFLYGYYAEDPNYKGGVRAIIEAIYEPPQKGTISEVDLLEDPYENHVNFIAECLGFERIGWIFTDMNHDCFLDSKAVRKAAQYQEAHITVHQSGYKISNFITVVIRTKKDRPEEVAPEVYMVSDQAQALERDDVFGVSDRRRFLNVREPKFENDILPTIISGGKPVKEIEPDFFIVNIAHGQPKNNNFCTLKHSDFPVENRPEGQKPSDVKNYLQTFKNQPLHVKYADFHLILYIAKILDIDTAIAIASGVRDEQPFSSDIEDLIKQVCM